MTKADIHAAIRKDLQQLGLDDGEPTVGALARYLGLLQRWNAAYNLTAIRDPEAMRIQHLADCLAIVPALRRRVHAAGLPDMLKVLDVGSGGGLPGVVLAILHPAWEVHCVDAVAKKSAFIRQVAGELGLQRLHAVHERVEAMRPAQGFDLVVSRAFASLADFTGWTHKLLAPQGLWMAMKGKVPTDEIAALRPEVEAIDVEPVQVPGLVADRCLVWMKISATTSII